MKFSLRFSKCRLSIALTAFLLIGCPYLATPQSFFLPTPYPTETPTPTPGPANLALGQPFAEISGIVLNPREKTEEQKREDAKARQYRYFKEEERRLSLSDLKGKVVLVYFWRSDSPQAGHEVERLLDLYRRYKPQGLEILGISLDPTPTDTLSFLRDWGIDWPVFWDEGGWESPRATEFQVQALPRNFLVDGGGRLQATNVRGAMLESVIEQLAGPSSIPAYGSLIRIEPEKPEPDAEFVLEYRPIRKSHKTAPSLQAAFEPGKPRLEWDVFDLDKTTDRKDGVVWSARLTYPPDQVQLRVFIGPNLGKTPPGQIQTSPQVAEANIESAGLERIQNLAREARELEDNEEWAKGAGKWFEVMKITPSDPLVYARAVLGVVRCATKIPSILNPITLVQRIPNLPLQADRPAAELAVRETLPPGVPLEVDVWLARAAATLMYETALLTTETLTASYIDTFAWALYQGGYPDRALKELDRIPTGTFFHDPAIALRRILYQLQAGQPDEAKHLYRMLMKYSGPLLPWIPEVPAHQAQLFRLMPEHELLSGEIKTTVTLAGTLPWVREWEVRGIPPAGSEETPDGRSASPEDAAAIGSPLHTPAPPISESPETVSPQDSTP